MITQRVIHLNKLHHPDRHGGKATMNLGEVRGVMS